MAFKVKAFFFRIKNIFAGEIIVWIDSGWVDRMQKSIHKLNIVLSKLILLTSMSLILQKQSNSN